MTEAFLPDYFGRTIFSEDVRPEAAGSFTVVGLIPGGVEVEGFPAVLPKLGCVMEWQQKLSVERLPLTLRIFTPGREQAVWEHVHTADALEGAVPDEFSALDRGLYPGPTVLRVFQVAVFGMFQIDEPGWVQVRAFRGEEVLAMGGLRISAP